MSARARILFVDDEEHIVATLKALFKSKFDVYTATSGAAALDVVKAHQIHVIVSDQRMPEMEGIELLRAVKELSPSTMRILLTGYSDFNAIVGSVNAGEVYRYIYKPWSNKEIQSLVEAAASVGMSLVGSDITADDLRAADAASAAAGILVIEDDLQIRGSIEKLFSTRCPVWTALNCSEALDILERENVGVVVTDVYVGRQDITAFIKILKEQHPSIVTVVLTKFNDANMVVGLINHGQIYRYLGKPVHQAQLRVSVDAALTYHAKCRRQPKLLSRHRVERVDESANSGLAAMIMSRLRSLRTSIAAR